MAHSDGKFLHESLQDKKSVKALLDSLSKAIGKGEVVLSDDREELTLPLDSLLNLRIKADRADGRCRVDIRLSWQERAPVLEKKSAPKVT